MHHAKDRTSSMARGLVQGALAGVAASWVMGQVTSYMYQQESEDTREEEQDAREGKMAYGVAAEKVAEFAGQELTKEQRQTVGKKIHWALGIGAGAAYSAWREPGWGVKMGRGLAFGTGFYLLMDEVANPALGLTPGPTAFPWQAHARGFVGHLAFGAATEALMGLME